jgi:hypothetical protein
LEELRAEWPEDGALIVVDAATVRRHPTLTAPWGVGEDVPEVPTGDDHPTVHGYGAVAPLTGRTHAQPQPPVGAGGVCAVPAALVGLPSRETTGGHA